MSEPVELLRTEATALEILRVAGDVGCLPADVRQAAGWRYPNCSLVLCRLQKMSYAEKYGRRWLVTRAGAEITYSAVHRRMTPELSAVCVANIRKAKSTPSASGVLPDDDDSFARPSVREYRPHGTWQAGPINAPTSVFDVARMV